LVVLLCAALEIQSQHIKDQSSRLVIGVIGAMTVEQVSCGELRGNLPNQLATG
jgi:hypothetical protein